MANARPYERTHARRITRTEQPQPSSTGASRY